MGKTLIAYFSRAGQNDVNGSIVELEKGNTEIAAEMIQKLTGGELFKIDPVEKYSDDYQECVKEAVRDLKSDARPELETYLDDLNDVDTVILGYPSYCSTMPMPVFTFLEKYDFTGKRIRPFCTNEGSGMGRSEADIKKMCPNATITEGLPIHGASVRDAEADIKKWLG
ncbi:MAG: flavodoxin [Lachnospiraceae bacterium]|nr:flavodoxin [Lachnospiraceae bacterium]